MISARRIISSSWIPAALLAAVLLASLFFFDHAPRVRFDGSYATTVSISTDAISGKGPPADLAQDIVGLRAMLSGDNAYPILAPAFKQMLDLHWKVTTTSTHPPSAFLLTFPVAFLPWPTALQVWFILMLGCTLLSLILLRLRWPFVVGGFLLLLAWPPLILSFGQITAVWLLGFCIAYRLKDRAPLWSGAGAALAASTKLTPALLVVPYIYRRNRTALLGFLGFAALMLVAVLVLSPGAILQFVSANLSNSSETLSRFDNGSLLAVMAAIFGPWGVPLALLYLGLILLACLPHLRADDDLVWMLAGYFSVALLPIAWGYSLLPLLPVMVYFLRSRQPVSMFIVALVFILPFFGPMGSEISARLTAGAIGLIGAGFLPLIVQRSAFHAPVKEVVAEGSE